MAGGFFLLADGRMGDRPGLLGPTPLTYSNVPMDEHEALNRGLVFFGSKEVGRAAGGEQIDFGRLRVKH